MGKTYKQRTNTVRHKTKKKVGEHGSALIQVVLPPKAFADMLAKERGERRYHTTDAMAIR